MAVYTLTEAEDKLATVLEKATSEGEVQIRGDEGRLFVVKPDPRRSALDVEGIDVDISKEEIVSIIRECRERRPTLRVPPTSRFFGGRGG